MELSNDGKPTFQTFKTSIRSYMEHLVESGRTIATAAHIQSRLRHFARYCGEHKDPRTVDGSAVDQFCAARTINSRQATHEKYLLWAFLRWTKDEAAPQSRQGNAGLQAPRARKGALTEQEETRLRTSTLPTKLRLLIEMGMHSGLRAEEICQLKTGPMPEQIQTTLKGTTRTIFTTEAARCAAAELSNGRPAGEPLLLTERGRAADPHDLNRWTKKAAKIAGVDEQITSHMLRHTFATTVRENGGKLEDIAEMLGHAHVDTTRIYARPRPDWIGAQLAAHHPAHAKTTNEP